MKEEDKLLRDIIIEYINNNWNPERNILYDFKYELDGDVYIFDMTMDYGNDPYSNANEIYSHLSFPLLKNGVMSNMLDGVDVVLDSSRNINKHEEFKHILNYINPIVCYWKDRKVFKYKCKDLKYSEDLWCKDEICELN